MTPETIEMVVATEDASVPSYNQNLLHEAFGEPETQFIATDHFDAILSTLLFSGKRKKIAQFFKERFRLKNSRPDLFDFLNPTPTVLAASSHF